MKRMHLIALVFVVIAIGAVVSTLYKADTYAGFEEARAHPGREFNIIGRLVGDVPVREQVVNNTLVLSFTLEDHHGERSEVIYFGPKPQDFEQSDEVVLIGKMEAERFVASSLLLKCPSKYNPEDAPGAEYLFD